ncbi:uncharacterized protein eva1ab isoform X2 [Maylandia zebra]|uniref:uncharacterized protein eva1ab isoform X2 n=1 Tax=Maylandia zebra TaxID=106582 RepID=UPI00403CABA3
MSAPTTGSPNMEVKVVSQEMALLSNILAAYTFIAAEKGSATLAHWLKDRCVEVRRWKQCKDNRQTSPRGQRLCFLAACALAFLSHCAPSSSKYTVEQTATMATLTIFPIAQGTDSNIVGITAVTTISPQTVTQTILPSSPLERLGPLGKVSLRTGMTQLIHQPGDADALRDP